MVHFADFTYCFMFPLSIQDDPSPMNLLKFAAANLGEKLVSVFCSNLTKIVSFIFHSKVIVLKVSKSQKKLYVVLDSSKKKTNSEAIH